MESEIKILNGLKQQLLNRYAEYENLNYELGKQGTRYAISKIDEAIAWLELLHVNDAKKVVADEMRNCLQKSFVR